MRAIIFAGFLLHLLDVNLFEVLNLFRPSLATDQAKLEALSKTRQIHIKFSDNSYNNSSKRQNSTSSRTLDSI